MGELVDFFLSTPNSLRATSMPPLTQGNGAIDPLVSDDELVMNCGCKRRAPAHHDAPPVHFDAGADDGKHR